jgi:hypothetical protein
MERGDMSIDNLYLQGFETAGRRASFILAGNDGNHWDGMNGVAHCKKLFKAAPELQTEMLEIGNKHFIFADEMKGWV